LQNDGNPWRGMVYGMTSRVGWSVKSDPRPLWDLWTRVGMQGTEMIGYWSAHCPVKTNSDKVLVTVYKKKGLAVLSMASWADTTASVKLQIDWNLLGMDQNKVSITAPAIKDFQSQHDFAKDQMITVEKNKGWLLLIKEN
jgi:hypothetical protein